MAIAVLDEIQLTEIIRQAVLLATADLREELERARTPELMTRELLAQYLSCHPSTITRYIKLGLPVEHCGDQPRYRKASVDRWLQRNDASFQEISRKADNGQGSELSEGPMVGAQMYSGADHSPADSRGPD